MKQLIITILLVLFNLKLAAATLCNNLAKTDQGDFVVTTQNKNYSLLHVHDKDDSTVTIEEITVPVGRMTQYRIDWREWVAQGAPNHTSWVLYKIKLATGEISNCFSVGQRKWIQIPKQEQFLPTLLNLSLREVPNEERRRMGRGSASYWNPPMVVNGQTVTGVAFTAWRADWPQDGTPLAGKAIDIYLPEESDKYPAYFPYWLQMKGGVGSHTVRIVDSGTDLKSPIPSIPPLGVN